MQLPGIRSPGTVREVDQRFQAPEPISAADGPKAIILLQGEEAVLSQGRKANPSGIPFLGSDLGPRACLKSGYINSPTWATVPTSIHSGD